MTRSELEKRLATILENHGVMATPSSTDLLGANGLGLDSIALVEVLFACESTFQIAIAEELLAAKSPLTFGSLVEHIEARIRT